MLATDCPAFFGGLALLLAALDSTACSLYNVAVDRQQ